MEIKIIVIAVLIIALAYFTNVFVTLRSSKQNLDKITETITDSIQKYLDMVPLFLLKLEMQNESIDQKREDWFNNWNTIKKHWPIWIELSEEIISLYAQENKSSQDVIKRMRQQEQVINENVHHYNEKLIHLENKLKTISSKAIKAAMGLKLGRYSHLAN